MKKYSFYDLKNLNSFRLNCIAEVLYELEHEADALKLPVPFLLENDYHILSGGNNIIFLSSKIKCVVKNAIKAIVVLESANSSVLVEVGGGVNWSHFLIWAARNNLYGLENLYYIPGNVGAAPVQNIGAYGVEVANFISHVKVFDFHDRKIKIIKSEDCNFFYRSSIFKLNYRRYLILSVVFKLDVNWKPNLDYMYLTDPNFEVRSNFDFLLKIKKMRSKKLPSLKNSPNVGSFFINPMLSSSVVDVLREKYLSMPVYKVDSHCSKISAAWLIEKAGWKGRCNGKVGVSDCHSLILINRDPYACKGSDVLDFATSIVDDIYLKFGVVLKIEPVLI